MHRCDGSVVFPIHMDDSMDDRAGCGAEFTDGSLKRWSVGGRVSVGGRTGEAWRRWWVAGGRAFGV